MRVIIFPGTQQILLEAIRRGYIETFVQAGAVVSTPTCGPCLGGHMGILAKGERALATTNRNFVGRMGHPQSEVYLSSPAVATFAITGEITPLGSVCDLYVSIKSKRCEDEIQARSINLVPMWIPMPSYRPGT